MTDKHAPETNRRENLKHLELEKLIQVMIAYHAQANGSISDKYFQAYCDAHSELMERFNYISGLQDEIERLKGEQEWISVEDRLPDMRLRVLVTNVHGMMSVTDWEPFTNKPKEWFMNCFTHWKPLPPQP